MVDYIVAVDGLDALNYMSEVPATVERNAMRAVNKTTRDGRALAAKEIRKQVAFSASYLSPNSGRLSVSKSAKMGDLSGEITGRARPTSLARFTKEKPLAKGQQTARRTKGVKVSVKPGSARYLRGAFVIPIRRGNTGELGNLGLAIRSDTQPQGSYKPKKLGKNVWLLYGPSVSQILYSARNNGGVADEIAPELAAKLEAEFNRLQALDLD